MKKDQRPPQWVDSLVDNLASHDFAEEIRGDLYELYLTDIAERGISYAKRKYVFNGLGFLAKNFFWKKQSSHTTNSFIMIRSYFKMAQRSLLAYKGNTIINILGLVIGIASALVITTVIRYELSFDTFHSDTDRIYRMVRVSGEDLSAMERSQCRTGISYPVPAAIKEEISSLEDITSMQYYGGVLVEVLDKSGSVLRKFREDRGLAFVEPSFFRIFDFKDTDFKWIEGNPEKALTEPLSVVLTKTLAKKYFPEGNALGMTIKLEKDADCKVTGVIEDLPPNTDFPFTALVSYVTVMQGEKMNDWISVDDDHHTYLKLTPGITQKEMEKQIAKVHEKHTSKDIYESRHYLLQELSGLHSDPRFGNFNGRTISRQTVIALALVGLFLLLTAAINYINLATAQSVMRAKEVGLRKVMGGNRKSLVAQLLTETFTVVFIAGLIALLLSELLLTNLQSLLNIQATGYYLTDPFVLSSLFVIILVVTLFSGIYPSLVISRFSPVIALKNKFATERIGGFSMRKVLVVTQFTLTQMLVVGTFIVVAQIKFFQNVDMGFNHEAVITMTLPGRTDLGKIGLMEDQLKSLTSVSTVSFSSTLPSGLRRYRSFRDIARPEATSSKEYVIFEYQVIDPHYLDLYQIKLLAGRNISWADSSGNILINKTLARSLRLGSPEEAISKELKMGGDKVTVVGVVDDFFSNSLKESVDNMVFVVRPRASAFVSVKLAIPGGNGSMQDAITQIEKIWTASYPEHIFSYEFLDENIKAFYAQEQKYAQLFQLFSLIFLLIGCLGLYGLITFVVNRKGKEVAIRKVLGASLSNILVMFSKEYVQLIVLSFLLAVPVAFYAVTNWLSNFKNQIELQWWLFALPGILVLVIALLVVGIKSLNAANANPVDKLKYE